MLVNYPKLPSDSRKALVAYAKADEGELIVLDIPLWWKWIGCDYLSKADNGMLLQNLLTASMANRKKGTPEAKSD